MTVTESRADLEGEQATRVDLDAAHPNGGGALPRYPRGNGSGRHGSGSRRSRARRRARVAIEVGIGLILLVDGIDSVHSAYRRFGRAVDTWITGVPQRERRHTRELLLLHLLRAFDALESRPAGPTDTRAAPWR